MPLPVAHPVFAIVIVQVTLNAARQQQVGLLPIIRVAVGCPGLQAHGTELLLRVADHAGPTLIDDNLTGGHIPFPGACIGTQDDVVQAFALGQHGLLRQPGRGDVGVDGDVFFNGAAGVEKRRDAGVNPIQGAVLGTVAHHVAPGVATGDGLPHGAPEFIRLGLGLDDAVALPQQFFAAVAADAAKLVVDADDVAGGVGNRHDRMLVNGFHQGL